MDEEKCEEDEKHALEGFSNEPTPRKKVHSYCHQLRTNTGTHHKRYHQFRHHSFDIPANIIIQNNNNHHGVFYDDDSDDDEYFHPYSTYSNNTTTTGASSAGTTEPAVSKDDDINQQKPLPEFVAGGGGVGIFKVPTRGSVHLMKHRH